MKKLAVAIVIATVGLFKLHAESFSWEDGFGSEPPPGLASVRVNLAILGQGNTNVTTNVTGSVITTVHFKQSKIDDNTILGLINDEFGTSFSVTNGDYLAVSNFWDGNLIVLGRDGTTLLQNASSNTNGDHYALSFTYSNSVFAETGTTNFETKFSVSDGFLNYESGDGFDSFHLEGFTTVNDSYCHGLTNGSESFQLSGGIGSASFSTNGVSGILTGSVSGSGKDNAPAP